MEAEAELGAESEEADAKRPLLPPAVDGLAAVRGCALHSLDATSSNAIRELSVAVDRRQSSRVKSGEGKMKSAADARGTCGLPLAWAAALSTATGVRFVVSGLAARARRPPCLARTVVLHSELTRVLFLVCFAETEMVDHTAVTVGVGKGAEEPSATLCYATRRARSRLSPPSNSSPRERARQCISFAVTQGSYLLLRGPGACVAGASVGGGPTSLPDFPATAAAPPPSPSHAC